MKFKGLSTLLVLVLLSGCGTVSKLERNNAGMEKNRGYIEQQEQKEQEVIERYNVPEDIDKWSAEDFDSYWGSKKVQVMSIYGSESPALEDFSRVASESLNEFNIDIEAYASELDEKYPELTEEEYEKLLQEKMDRFANIQRYMVVTSLTDQDRLDTMGIKPMSTKEDFYSLSPAQRSLLINHPWFAPRTEAAYKKTKELIALYTGSAEHTGGDRRDAFRHVLFTTLIARYCIMDNFGSFKSQLKEWAYAFMAANEVRSGNREADMLMDFNNNAAGLRFIDEKFASRSKTYRFLWWRWKRYWVEAPSVGSLAQDIFNKVNMEGFFLDPEDGYLNIISGIVNKNYLIYDNNFYASVPSWIRYNIIENNSLGLNMSLWAKGRVSGHENQIIYYENK